MVAEYYGREIDSDTLIRLSAVNETGTSIFNLAKAAEVIGFTVLPLSIPFNKLGDITPLPCIAHYRKDHFVVIYEVGENTVTYADPAVGLLTKPKSHFLKAWMKPDDAGAGYVLVLEPLKVKKWRFPELLTHLLPHKKHLFYAILLLAIGTGLQILFPLLTQHIVDGAISKQNIELLYLLLIGQVMITLGRMTSDIVRRRILLALTSNVNTSISLKLLTKLTRLPLKYFDTRKMSDLRQRVSDIEAIEKFVSGTTLTFAFSMIGLVVYSFLLVSYNLQIYLIVFGSSVIHLVFITRSMKQLKALNAARFNARSDSDSKLTHIVSGITDVKLNNYERKVLADWKTTRKDTFKISLETIKANQKQETGAALIMELSNVICVFIAAKAVIGGEMTLGAMIALQYMTGQLRAPVLESVNFFRAAQEANLSFERVNEILDLPEESSENTNLLIAGIRENIAITDVSFRYPGSDHRSALHDVSVTIPAGKVTAIVGASGSGKSTLMKLLLGIYEPSSGEIRIGAHRFDEIDTGEWRKRAAIVLQEGYIFPGTIAENIALCSESEYEPDRLANAVKIANISDLVARLPQGIHTPVRNENFSLSKGERQRILIARAIYRDPEYLFLDEATASLDSDNENIILNNIINHFYSRTVVIITHRVSMIAGASQIIVMENGRVVDAGTHGELIERQPAYVRLQDSQALYENI